MADWGEDLHWLSDRFFLLSGAKSTSLSAEAAVILRVRTRRFPAPRFTKDAPVKTSWELDELIVLSEREAVYP